MKNEERGKVVEVLRLNSARNLPDLMVGVCGDSVSPLIRLWVLPTAGLFAYSAGPNRLTTNQLQRWRKLARLTN